MASIFYCTEDDPEPPPPDNSEAIKVLADFLVITQLAASRLGPMARLGLSPAEWAQIREQYDHRIAQYIGWSTTEIIEEHLQESQAAAANQWALAEGYQVRGDPMNTFRAEARAQLAELASGLLAGIQRICDDDPRA